MAEDPSKLSSPGPGEAAAQANSSAPESGLEEDAGDESGGDPFAADDPLALFADWYARAEDKEPRDASAMTLATVDESGTPDARMVLLKGVTEGGFVFYTNLESRKGRQLADNPRAALCFHWKSLNRQVRVRGPIAPVSAEEADAYFASRPREARIGAWASDQSRPMEGRFELEARVAKYAARFGLGEVPRPPHWSGFRLTPLRIEFWRGRLFRLHDRRVFERDDAGAPWRTARLYP